MKTDQSIHGLCIAAIKRHTIKPYNFDHTRFYETNAGFLDSIDSIKMEFLANERIIASTIIDPGNYSILTSQRLITAENSILASTNMAGTTDKGYGDFKGFKKNTFTFGQLQLEDGGIFKYFIETGKASMIMIYGVSTLIQITKITVPQKEEFTGIYNKKQDSF